MYILKTIIFILLFSFTLMATETENTTEIIQKDPKNYTQKNTDISIADSNGTIQDIFIGTKVPIKPKKYYGMENKLEGASNYIRVSLIDVILETISNNNNVKAAREKVIQANLLLDDSYSGYKPTIDVEYKNSNNNKTPGDTGAISGSHDYDDENLKVFFRQNLYAGNETQYNIKAQEKSLEVAKNRYELVISQEIQNAIRAYFGVVFAHQSLNVTKKNMKTLKEIIEIVTIRYDLGAASIADLSSIKANVANAESKLNITSSQFIEALKYYEYIIGENFKHTLPYEYEYDIRVDPEEELLRIADEKNLNIVNYIRNVESLQYQLKGSSSSFKPQVNLEYIYTRSFDRDITPSYIQDMNEMIVTVNYNLYNGNKDSNAKISIYSAIRELQYKIAQERRKVKWIISNSYQSLSALNQAIANIKKEIDSSQTMVESYWEMFQNGEQDLQTLLIGQRQLNTAEVSLIDSYKNRLNDYFKILFETGELVSYFNLDPTKSNFIDFTKSTYQNTHTHDVEDNFNLSELIKIEVENEDADEDKEIELQKEVVIYDSLEDILVFKDKFLDSDDNNLTIFINDFETMYASFAFIKDNNLTRNTFVINTIENNKLKYAMAYGIYENSKLADSDLNAMKKSAKKNYEIVSIQKIKELYKKSLDEFDVLKPKTIVKTKIIKLIPKPPKQYFTNKTFKEKFINASQDKFTINLVTFSNLDDAISLINEEKIATKTFMFRYGKNAEWVKVIYGVFDTYEEAQSALSNLSAVTKEKYYPIVENIKNQQELYTKYSTQELGVPSSQVGAIEYMKLSEELKTENEDK